EVLERYDLEVALAREVRGELLERTEVAYVLGVVLEDDRDRLPARLSRAPTDDFQHVLHLREGEAGEVGDVIVRGPDEAFQLLEESHGRPRRFRPDRVRVLLAVAPLAPAVAHRKRRLIGRPR